MRLHGSRLNDDATRARTASRRRTRAGAVGVALLVGVVAAACNNSASGNTGGQQSSTQKASFNTLIEEGIAAQNAGNAQQAETYYKQAVALQPTNPTALYDLADLQQTALNDTTDAELNYRKALAINPNNVNALFNLAILVTKANPAQAEAYYEQIISIDPKGSASAHLNLGFLLMSLGHRAQGISQIRTAARMNPAFANRIPTSGPSGATKSG